MNDQPEQPALAQQERVRLSRDGVGSVEGFYSWGGVRVGASWIGILYFWSDQGSSVLRICSFWSGVRDWRGRDRHSLFLGWSGIVDRCCFVPVHLDLLCSFVGIRTDDISFAFLHPPDFCSCCVYIYIYIYIL